jgi:hypothetical protein
MHGLLESLIRFGGETRGALTFVGCPVHVRGTLFFLYTIHEAIIPLMAELSKGRESPPGQSSLLRKGRSLS